MDTEANPRSRHGGEHPVSIFITSLSAAIVVAGGFGIIVEAFIVAGSDLFQLGQTFVLVGSVITGLLTLWLFAWCFARSVHVERRLAQGLEIDEPKLSILTNFRDSRPALSKP
ncbi:MAG TPA: hypothetical protein VKD68_01065 [Methyloceanibacter sp.]|jgi:hypothetical protein|nr:hypothetical protein [Methyloceanibacter sp.]